MPSHPWKQLISFSLSAALAGPFAVSVSASPADSPRLETLVVTASREQRPWLTTPGAATRLDSLRQLPGLRIDSAELLQGLAGLQVDSRSNYAQDTRLVLRGFGARSAFGVRGMDVRLDHIPLSMPDGQAQLGSVLLEEVDSVEVLRGPLATLYGNGAGGVVLLRTKAPAETGAVASMSAGANESHKQSLAGTWRGGRWGMRGQASHLRSDGFREHSELERYQGGAQLYYEGDDLAVTLRADGSRDPETEDPSGLSPEQWREDPEQVAAGARLFNTRKGIKYRQFSLNVEKALGENVWQTSAWQGTREVKQWLPFPGADITSSGAVIDLEREFSGLQTSYRHKFSFAQPLTWTLGLSLERMEDSRRGYVNDFGEVGELRRDEVGDVDSNDIFTLVDWQPLERMTLIGGFRHSRSEFSVEDRFIVPGNPDDSGNLDYSESSSALGISYQLDANWALFASAGTGFETPTLTEMAYRNEGTGLNTGLKPSRNEQLEGGLHFRRADLQAAVTIFTVDSEDELVVDQSIGGRTTYYNAAETRRYGLELEGDWEVAPGVSTRASATWLDAEYSKGEWSGNRLPGVARTQVYGQMNWQPWQSPLLTLSLDGRYRSAVPTGDDNQVEAPDYVTFDLAVSSQHDWRNSEILGWLRLENVTDETYVGSVIVNQGNGRSFEPAPGRSVMVGVDLRI